MTDSRIELIQRAILKLDELYDIGDGMEAHFEFVSEISLTKSGKRRFIISKVKPEL